MRQGKPLWGRVIIGFTGPRRKFRTLGTELAGTVKAVFLLGPTASGKSAVALELADRFPMEIVSVDSAQVFRGMDVGTAKPDAATRKTILVDTPERLYRFPRA